MKKILSLLMVIVCLMMSFMTSEVFAACNHNWVVIHADKDSAPCKEYDATFRCSKCGDMKQDTVAPTAEHNWAVANSQERTCLDNGHISYYCTECFELKKEIIPAYGSHDHSFIYNNDATCTKDGTKFGTCKRCGKSEMLTDIGSAKGHSYDDKWILTFAGNCVSKSSSRRNCKTCGEPQVVYGDYGAHTDSNKDYICDLCNADLKPSSPSNPQAPDNAVEDCSCKCHKGGITGFFWKIGNFFAKLFRIKSKQICSCGKYHF